MLAAFHAAEAGLIFNSGYDANLSPLSCVPLKRGDTIIYDYLSHACYVMASALVLPNPLLSGIMIWKT